MGFPVPSARRWILVENPPRLRPRASISCGSSVGAAGLPPFFERPRQHPQRAGALLQCFRPRDADPSPTLQRCPPLSVTLRAHGPTPRPRPSGRSGWRCSARDQTPVADRARALRCDLSREWLRPQCDDLWRGGPFSAFVAVRADVSAPTARRSRSLVPCFEANIFENSP